MWKLILLTVNVLLNNNIEAVTYFSKCKLEDSNCLKKTAQDFTPTFAAGLKELGVEATDPLFIKYVNASTSTLKLILTDTTITGFKDAEIKKLKFDKTKTKISFKLEATIQLEGQYDMSGNLLFLRIEGQGPLHVKLRKIEVPITVKVKEETGSDGKKYWIYEYVSHSYLLKEKSEVEFKNLFSKNDVLATAAKEMISQNGNEIIYEVGSPVIKAVIDSIIVRINELFKKIPTDELYIP